MGSRGNPVGVRREARELALQCLHQWDQRPEEGRDLAGPLISDRAKSPEQAEYCHQVLKAFWEHSVVIDECIATAAANWSVDRMAVVDRNILRLAVTELKFLREIPPKVALDEAIELAKKYSTEKSGAFVNGILDKIRKEPPHGVG